MEKNIRKRVCRLAAVLSAVLVVLFGYWFFLNPHGYWQKKKEAEKNEYMDRRMLWRKSEKMTMQHTATPFYNGAKEVQEAYMRIYAFDYKKACCNQNDFEFKKLD